MATTDRKAKLVEAQKIRQGDLVAFSTRQAPAEVKGIERRGTLLEFTTVGLGTRICRLEEKVLLYEPKPTTKTADRREGLK